MQDEIKKEIEKIIVYQNSILPKSERKNEATVSKIINDVLDDFEQKNFDFSKYISININRDGKTRCTKMYKPFSSEEILCIYIKRLLDRKFHIKYPNRNEYMHNLFDTVNALRNMSDYTIFRFDFKNFFNSVSSQYVYNKYIITMNFERYQYNIIEDFVSKTKYAYAGLNTSNIFCEIIAQNFDEELRLITKDNGVIFYKRYIDDGIIIFNSYINKDECIDIIESAIKNVFFDDNFKCAQKCKTKLNESKTQYISARDLYKVDGNTETFDYLGYLFVLLNKDKNTEFKYGITKKKIDKYTRKLDDLVKEYLKTNDLELLRHQIKAFTHRTVYQIYKYKTPIWKTKGFIANYGELRFRIESLTDETESFLKTVVYNTIKINGIEMPYFLKGKKCKESIYSLYNNLEKNRTLLFVERIGIGKESLMRLCEKINISITKDKSYDGLVRDYLIKIKVGH